MEYWIIHLSTNVSILSKQIFALFERGSNPGWPWTHDFPASAFQVQGFQACAICLPPSKHIWYTSLFQSPRAFKAYHVCFMNVPVEKDGLHPLFLQAKDHWGHSSIELCSQTATLVRDSLCCGLDTHPQKHVSKPRSLSVVLLGDDWTFAGGTL